MSKTEKIITYIRDSIGKIWDFLSYPGQLRDDLAASILDLLNEYDLDLIYTGTVFVNLVILSYWKDFRDWKSLSESYRQLVQVKVVGAVFFNLLSILKLLGVISF